MNESENSWNVEMQLQKLERQQNEMEKKLKEKEQKIQELSSLKLELESTLQEQSKKIAEQSENIKSLNEQIGTLHESDVQLCLAQEIKENAENSLKEAAIAKSKADTAISNAEREREQAEKQKMEYRRLCDEQKTEIEKAAAKKTKDNLRALEHLYRKREWELQERFRRKTMACYFVLAELGIYGLVMTILYLS